MVTSKQLLTKRHLPTDGGPVFPVVATGRERDGFPEDPSVSLEQCFFSFLRL